MARAHVIFVNKDTQSDIFTLFDGKKDDSQDVQTTNDEISLEELETAILSTTAGDIVYILHRNLSTSINSDQFTQIRDYLYNIFITDTSDDVDIFYLSNFMDNCLNRSELGVQPTVDKILNVSITFSTAPNGIGCVATTKEKWLNIIALAKLQDEKNLSAKLSAMVIGEKIIAATSQPLFVFPDLNKITDSLDALKTQYCRIEKNFGRAVPNTENLSFFWFVLGVSIIVFVAWILSYYMPKNRVMLTNKY